MSLFQLIKQQSIRLIKASGYSYEGLHIALKTEPAFVLECIACIILIPLALLLHVSPMMKVALISSLLLMLIVELLNSGIEAVVDRISVEKHDLSKKAKDVGSAAVLLTIINAIVVWSLLLLDLDA